jgi:hypothetical protein
MPIIWGLGNPKIGEREVTRALLEHDHHLIASGQLIMADKGSPAATSNRSSPPTSART